MAHGGKRPGAGRKPGSTNRFNRDLLASASATGALPVEYLLEVMRDASNPISLRIDAAKSCAPYLHHKLSAQDISVSTQADSHESWLETLVDAM